MGKTKPEDSNNVNKELSDMLYELSFYEKNVAGNIHKYNAYRQAAKSIANLSERITSIEEAKKLPGIGQKIIDKIAQFLETGTILKFEKIKKNDKYQAIILLTKVSGIGPVKAKELVDKGVRTINDLEKFKKKLTHHQQIGLKYFHDFEKRIPRNEISGIEKVLKEEIFNIDENYTVTICGSYRRGKATSGDIDCLITHPGYATNQSKNKKSVPDETLKTVVSRLENIGLIIDTIALGRTKFMGVCRLNDEKPARRLDIRFTPHDQYFCCVLYFTGSDVFNKNMRTHALQQGFTLNEYSLRPIGETGVLGKPVPLTSEKDIFDYIMYPYKTPEERDE